MTEFSIVHGGKHDIKRHCNSTSHLKAVEDSRKNGKQARLIDLRTESQIRLVFIRFFFIVTQTFCVCSQVIIWHEMHCHFYFLRLSR